MIQMDEKETIRRLYFIKRHSIRQIAEELNHSRKTVRKAIADASVPQYHLTAPKPSPVMGPHMNKVMEWLEKDKSRRKISKCDLCFGDEVPACVANCPNEALVYAEASEPVPG